MSVTAVIMQPTYLPWAGYFDLLDQSDVFVFLDSVQFNKRSWQQRNRIKQPGGELLLTVPVRSKGRREQMIYEVEIDPSSDFRRAHAESVRRLYAKAPFAALIAGYEETLGRGHERLADLNMALIRWMAECFGLDKKIVRSSELGITGRKTDLLVSICRAVGATEYLSPPGSQDYMEENLFTERGLALRWHEFVHPVYPQLHGAFVSHLSALDLLLNAGGPEGIALIRSGRKKLAV